MRHCVLKVRRCGWSDGGGVLLGGKSAQWHAVEVTGCWFVFFVQADA